MRSESTSLSAGEERHTFASMSMIPASGAGQTFPETPHAFSPMFSPGIDQSQGNVLSLPDSSTWRTTSLHGRSNRLSRRFVVGRSASTKAFVGMKAHNRLSASKLKRSSTGIVTPAILSPLPMGNAATTTKLDQVRFGNGTSTRPRSVASDDSSDHAYSRRPTFSRQSDSQKETVIPPAPLAPSQILSTQETAESLPSPVSPSLVSLPPPPPPPQLGPPPPPVSQVSSVSPSPRTPARLPRADAPSIDDFQPGVSLLRRTLTAPPPAVPSVAPPDNPLAGPPSLSGHAAATLPPNPCNADRPPRPLGPRRPYIKASSSPESRDRLFPSPSMKSSKSSGSCSVPKFRTSPPKFKGLTMEAAKWTFSSEELQAIVSQAIKQSGQASSIRLLSQQAAFIDIPEELERLNALLHELRVQYRLQVRKRDVLLGASCAYAESPEFSSIVLRSKLEELHETSMNLDRIAEELFHARDQVAQLSRMLAVHSGSALAMALRKLHSSFLRQKGEVETLRDHVIALEAERDEAWTQAQLVARDLDDLNDALQTQNSSPALSRSTSRRSSRAIASRKSILRAGLRLSQASPLPLCASSSIPDSIPPVPPIPRRPSSLGRITTSGPPSLDSGKHIFSLSHTLLSLSRLRGIFFFFGLFVVQSKPTRFVILIRDTCAGASRS